MVSGERCGERRGEGRGVDSWLVDGRGVVSRDDVSARFAALAVAAAANPLGKRFLVSPKNSLEAWSSLSLAGTCEIGRKPIAGGCGRGPPSGARREAAVAARVVGPLEAGNVGVATRRGGECGGHGGIGGRGRTRWAASVDLGASAAKARSLAGGGGEELMAARRQGSLE